MTVCDMCGEKEVSKQCIIEGVKMNVCERCAKYGKTVRRVATKEEEKIEQKQVKKRIARRDVLKKQEETVEVVVPDYSQKIRTARERRGLKQKDFAKLIAEKESVVHHLESGRMRPSIKLAKKLEKILHIKIIELIEEKKVQIHKGKSASLTIGDLLKK